MTSSETTIGLRAVVETAGARVLPFAAAILGDHAVSRIVFRDIEAGGSALVDEILEVDLINVQGVSSPGLGGYATMLREAVVRARASENTLARLWRASLATAWLTYLQRQDADTSEQAGADFLRLLRVHGLHLGVPINQLGYGLDMQLKLFGNGCALLGVSTTAYDAFARVCREPRIVQYLPAGGMEAIPGYLERFLHVRLAEQFAPGAPTT